MAETPTKRWTIAMLEQLPYEEGTRYEIVDGELLVSTQPRIEHQRACARSIAALSFWNDQYRPGDVLVAPGLIFSESTAVAPDVVWISHERLTRFVDDGGHLRGAPELVVEVLSPGATNARRDRELKLRVYSEYGADEYWILDWRVRQVEVYRREEGALRLAATLGATDTLTSPLLPGFSVAVAYFFNA